jgi:hypothetical protein
VPFTNFIVQASEMKMQRVVIDKIARIHAGPHPQGFDRSFESATSSSRIYDPKTPDENAARLKKNIAKVADRVVLSAETEYG